MRCRECNVDLPEEYTACPLCGGKVSDDAPLIDGITLAEYPKVKTEKYKRNPFTVFLAIWAVTIVAGILLFRFADVSEKIFALTVSLAPVLWTLIFRPLLVKQLYAGNYVVMNFFPAVFAGFLYCALTDNFRYFILDFLPVVCIVVMVALLVIVFIQPKTSKRAAPYPVFMGVFAVIMGIVSVVTQKILPFSWIGVFVVSAGILVIVFCKGPEKVKEELKAKFSIQ